MPLASSSTLSAASAAGRALRRPDAASARYGAADDSPRYASASAAANRTSASGDESSLESIGIASRPMASSLRAAIGAVTGSASCLARSSIRACRPAGGSTTATARTTRMYRARLWA